MLVCHWTAVLFCSSHCPSSAQLSRAVLSVHLSWGTQWTPKLMLSGDVPRMMPNQGEDIAEFPLQFYVFALRMPIAGKNTSVWWQYIIQWDLLFLFFFNFSFSQCHRAAEAGRDFWRPSSPSPGSLQHAAQDCIKLWASPRTETPQPPCSYHLCSTPCVSGQTMGRWSLKVNLSS